MSRAENRKYHYIYKITRFDGHYYYGRHSTDKLDDGYFGGGTRLWHSINYHGKDKHSIKIMEFFLSRKELIAREKDIVNEACLSDPLCMNIILGGEDKWGINSASIAATLGNLSPNRNHNVASAKANATKLLRGVKPAFTQGFRGKKFSEASAAKQKNSFAMIKHQQGEKNSQFGSCWVTDGIKPVKIKKEQLEEYLLKGYSRGRKRNTILQNNFMPR